MNGVIAITLGALLHAVWNIIGRSLRARARLAMWRGLASMSVFSAAVWASSNQLILTQPTLICLFVSAILHSIYFWALQEAYKDFELSSVYPFVRAIGVCVAVLMGFFLLDETISVTKIFGIVIICVGLILLCSNSYDRVETKRHFTLILLIGLLIGSAGTVDKIGIGNSPSPILYTITLFSLTAFFCGTKFIWNKPDASIETFTRIESISAFAWGPVVVISYGLILVALRSLPLTIVAPLREIALVYSTIFGALVLHERVGIKKILAVVFSFLGIMLVMFSLA